MSVVRITGTSGTESRDQLDAALVDHGLDRATVTELPFGLDTSLATNLTGLFEGMTALEVVPPMYILNVTVMDSMFDGCAALTSIPDLRTGNVTSAARMLAGTSALVDGQVRLIGRNQGVDTTDMIAGSGLTREPFYDEITAPAPTFDDVYVEVILPDIDVVEYTVIGEPERGAQVKVTAAPVGWVVLTGITEWVHTFPSVEGPEEPVPGDQPGEPPQPQPPLPGSYASRNAGRRASILEAFTQIVNQSELDEVDRKAEDAANEVLNLGTVVTDYGDALERKVEPWAVPTIAPLSQTINRRADPVFGLSDFMIPPVHGEDAASGLQAGGNTKGRIYMTFVTPALNRAYEQLNFFVSAVSNPCRMDVALYLVDPDTKVFTRQTLVTDADIPLSESVASVTFDRWVATQGSYICIAWLQHGSGNSRYLLGLNDTPRPLTNAIFPRKISAIHTQTGHTSMPATINGETQADFSFWFTPYAELSEDIGINYRAFTEGWGHNSAAPRPWVQVGRDTIWSAVGGYARIETTGSKRGAILYDTPLSTDYGRVRTRIHSIWSSGSAHTVLAIRATNDMRSGIGFAFNRHNYFLISWSNVSPNQIWDSSTTLLTVGITPSEGDQIEVDYLNGVVTARINGTPIITEHPVGGPQGAAGRFLGIYMRRTGDIFFTQAPPYIGPWSARDLPQTNGDDEDGDGEGEG